MPGPTRSNLLCHPIDEVRNPGFTISTIIAVLPDGCLAITYRVLGDAKRIKVPDRTSGGPADGLWRHTCFEAFVACNGAPRYMEFNFSPSGQWASYRFADYRTPSCQEQPPTAPELTIRVDHDVLELDASVPLAALPDMRPDDRLEIGLSAVIESADGALSHWAVLHPGDQPDFHNRDGFVINLPYRASAFPEEIP